MSVYAELTAALTGLAITIAGIYALFNWTFIPINNLDVDGFGMLQSQAGIYRRGEVLSDVLEGDVSRLFTPEHIVMLPLVDAEVLVPGGHRQILIVDNMIFRSYQTSSHPTTIFFNRAYRQDLETINNKELTVGSWVFLGEPFEIINTTLSGVPFERFHGILDGQSDRSNIIFFIESRPERWFWMLEREM